MDRSTVGIAALLTVPALGIWLTCGGSGLERTIPVEPGGKLDASLVLGSGLSFDKGSMQISSHDAKEVDVVVETSGWGGYAVDFDVAKTTEGVRVDGKVEGALHFLFGGPTVDVAIRVPRRYDVDAFISGGPLLLEGLGGEIVARGGGGHAGTIQQVDVRLRHTEGEVRLESEGGPIQVEDIEGSLSVKSGEGAVEVVGVSGPLRVRTDGGPIEVEYVEGQMQLQSEDGSIRADRVLGDVRVTTAHGAVELEDLAGNVEAVSSSGMIEIGDLTGTVEARSTSGSVEVEFREAPSGLIESDWGSIQVEIPGSARFNLDARSGIGQMQLDSGFDFVSTAEPPAVSSGPRTGDIGQEIRDLVAAQVENARRLAREHSRQRHWNWEGFRNRELRRHWRDERTRMRDGGAERADPDFSAESDASDQPGNDGNSRDALDDSGSRLVRAGLEGLGQLLAGVGGRYVGEVNGGGETLKLGTRTGSIQIRER